MQFGIISLFPEMFTALNYGITGRAVKQGQVNLQYWNPRDFTTVGTEYHFTHQCYRRVDDRPYGGGPGMVMKVEPLYKAIQAAKAQLGSKTQVIHLSPQGQLLSQPLMTDLVNNDQLILVASRYEGVDERLIELAIDQQYSIGDYVLTGGELPAMVLIDAMIRLIPGVLGHQESAKQDSFSHGLLDCPHYTRPACILGKEIPEVLQSGNHQAIATWRQQQALGKTWLQRNDLLQKRTLTQIEQQLLNDFIREYNEARGNCHE